MRIVAVIAILILAAPAAAKDAHCMARMLSDVAAEEAPEQVKSKSNGDFGPITEIKVDRQTGKMLYCAAGSYCYNSNGFELTTPCRIKRDTGGGDEKYFSFFTR